MARLARVVASGVPHHVTQRGNRRQQTFFNDGDYALYRQLIADSCGAAGVGVWAYCLMPNHVHLILTPGDPDGLRAALVRARLAAAAEDWPWSSARAHLAGAGDGLVDIRPLLDRAPDWRGLLDSALPQADYEALRRGERTGRPLGAADFVTRLEEQLGRRLAPQAPGRKPTGAISV